MSAPVGLPDQSLEAKSCITDNFPAVAVVRFWAIKAEFPPALRFTCEIDARCDLLRPLRNLPRKEAEALRQGRDEPTTLLLLYRLRGGLLPLPSALSKLVEEGDS